MCCYFGLQLHSTGSEQEVVWALMHWQSELTVSYLALQLNSRVSEQELVGAFRQFGNVVDYTIKRNTHCAYIDYDNSHSATLARRAMNGAQLGGSALRVEFKVSLTTCLSPVWLRWLWLMPKCCRGQA